MNREILFRGFHEDSNGSEEIELDGKIIKGKWVYGFYWTNGVGNHFVRIIKEKEDNFSKFTIENFEVILETVSQYTGLDDNYNQKIFEHDILRNYSNEIEDWIVCYEYGKFWGTYGIIAEDLWELHYLEVVGTIFDKKEMLDEN